MNQMPSEQASSRLDVDVNSPRPSKHPAEIENIILKAELAKRERETQELKEQLAKKTAIYSAENLGEDVIKMETGLNRHVFDAVVRNVESCKLNYHAGWKVESLSMENQVLITLMKARQNYTNLHLAQLFACSTRTISNIVITLFYVLHKLLYKDCMSTVPSRLKNSTSLPDSFSLFANCRMIFDCTDVKVATPALMSEQKLTYSTYRGMNSFKVLLGVAPNAVITFVSKLYPGSVSDKAIVEDSGLANVFEDGNLVLADKGFLIHDIMPDGVSVNIPPFLNKGKFSESEIKLTKSIAKCRIHVERANARLKDFQILSFIPPYLRVHADKIVQLCAALVNLQNPLIKEISDTIEFD